MNNKIDIDELKKIHKNTVISLNKSTLQHNKKVISFKSANEITKKLRGTQYLIKPFFEKNSIGFIYGKTGSKKSFLAIDIGLSIATGKDFHGRKTNKTTSFYFCGEGAEGIAKRIEAWKTYHSITNIENFFVSEMPGNFSDRNYIDNIIEALNSKSIENKCLIIIDTMSTNLGSNADENNNNDIAQFIRNLNKIRAKFQANILVIHHTGHSNNDRERGASAIGANSDYRIYIEETEDGLNMHSKKVKDRPKWKSISFKSKYIEFRHIVDSEGEYEGSLILEEINYDPVKNSNNTHLGKNQKLIRNVINYLAQKQINNLKSNNLKITDKIIIDINDIRESFILEKQNISTEKISKASIEKAWHRVKSEYPWDFKKTENGIFYSTQHKD